MAEPISRRELMRDAGIAAGTLAALGLGAASAEGAVAPAEAAAAEPAEYTLPPLPYAYDALEPHLDKRTLTLHHDKHHAGYVRGLNAALKKLAKARAENDAAAIKHVTRDLAFHGSGHVLHSLYWASMKPGGGEPKGALADAITKSFDTFHAFSNQFIAVTGGVAGSGWGVLAYEPLGRRLVILGVEKHENVAVSGMVPLLVCDVWEHAYYLKYQNRRAAYIEAWGKHLIDWNAVANRYATAVA